jgi:hypothetical protein
MKLRAGLFTILILSSCLPVPAQPAVEITGTLELEYLGAGRTNSFRFEFLSTPPTWELSLKPSNTESRREIFSSPEQTIWVTRYSGRSPTGPLNSAEIRLFPGSRPFDLRAEEHVWIAFLSGASFRGRTPIRDPGLCMAEPSIITKVATTPQAVSPCEMEWHNERADAKGISESRIEGQFRWLSTNSLTSAYNLPGESKLLISIIDRQGTRKQVTRSRLIISEINRTSRIARKMPGIQGRSPVADYRPAGVWRRVAVNYEIKDGNIPGPASVIVSHAYQNKFPPRPKRSLVFWVCAAVLVTSSLLLFRILKSKSKSTMST